MDGLAIAWLIIYTLAVMRITRILVLDRISEGARIAILRRSGEHGMVGYFVTCPWCVSIWVAAAATPLLHYQAGLDWWISGAAALAASHLTGLAFQLDTSELDVEVTER